MQTLNKILLLLSFFCLISCNEKMPEELAIGNPKQANLDLKGKRVLLYGDSMSSKDYVWYKEEVQKQTGADSVMLAGFSGYSTNMLAEDSQLQRIFDYKPDLIICLIGGNDRCNKGHVGSFGAIKDEPLVEETDIHGNFNDYFFIQAVSHIIRKIENHYQGTKPYLVLCTSLPQKRINGKNDFSNPNNWMRRRNAIVECCNKYDVHCVDLYKLTAWDLSKEPYWNPPTDTKTNRGVYTMDGLHPNETGYRQIVSIICSQLGCSN